MKDLKFFSKKVKSWWESLSWQEVALFVLVFIIGFPSVFVSWMIVDDGVSILFAQKISDFLSTFNLVGLWNLFLKEDVGRFRPAYWLFQWVSYLLAGKNPLLHHLIHFLMSGGTVFLIYSIIRILTFSKSAALVSSLIFLLASFNIENWYRLGTAEPMLTFYLALSLYFLVKNISLIQGPEKRVSNPNLLFSVLPLMLTYFTKENSFVLLPFAALLLLGVFLVRGRKRKTLWLKNCGYFLVANLILAMISLAIIIFIRTEGYYSSYYHVISLSGLIAHGRDYLGIIIKSFGFFAWILFFSFLVFSFFLFRKREFTLSHFLQFAFIIGFASFLIIQLPWAFVLGRYLEPALLFLVIVCGFEASRIFNLAPSKFKLKTRFSSLRNFFLFLAFIWLILVNGPLIFNYASDQIRGHRNIKEILVFVANEAPKNGKVFFNLKKGDATIELVFEGGLHLNLFYNRPDLAVEYLDEDKIKELKRGDLIITAIASEQFSAYKKADLEKIKALETVKTVCHKISHFYSEVTLDNKPKPFIYKFFPPIQYKFSTQESQWFVDRVI